MTDAARRMEAKSAVVLLLAWHRPVLDAFQRGHSPSAVTQNTPCATAAGIMGLPTPLRNAARLRNLHPVA